MFQGLPDDGLPRSTTPPGPVDLSPWLRSTGISPSFCKLKALGYFNLSRLNHAAFHLAVYASCRHYWTTRQDSLSVQALLADGFRTRLGDAAVFHFTPVGLRLCLYVLLFFSCFAFGFVLRVVPHRHALHGANRNHWTRKYHRGICSRESVVRGGHTGCVAPVSVRSWSAGPLPSFPGGPTTTRAVNREAHPHESGARSKTSRTNEVDEPRLSHPKSAPRTRSNDF